MLHYSLACTRKSPPWPSGWTRHTKGCVIGWLELPGVLMTRRLGILTATILLFASGLATAQDKASQPQAPAAKSSDAYSGMYTFLREGEFVQVTVEDQGHVTGFVSRYGDLDSDKGAFLDHFFKEGKLDGNKLTFTTETVHGVWFEFKGTVARGQGKNPGDEAYYVLNGTLVENSTDQNKKQASRSREVALKSFPQEASPVREKRD